MYVCTVWSTTTNFDTVTHVRRGVFIESQPFTQPSWGGARSSQFLGPYWHAQKWQNDHILAHKPDKEKPMLIRDHAMLLDPSFRGPHAQTFRPKVTKLGTVSYSWKSSVDPGTGASPWQMDWRDAPPPKKKSFCSLCALVRMALWYNAVADFSPESDREGSGTGNISARTWTPNYRLGLCDETTSQLE